jgi:hypothetical protein
VPLLKNRIDGIDNCSSFLLEQVPLRWIPTKSSSKRLSKRRCVAPRRYSIELQVDIQSHAKILVTSRYGPKRIHRHYLKSAEKASKIFCDLRRNFDGISKIL